MQMIKKYSLGDFDILIILLIFINFKRQLQRALFPKFPFDNGFFGKSLNMMMFWENRLRNATTWSYFRTSFQISLNNRYSVN